MMPRLRIAFVAAILFLIPASALATDALVLSGVHIAGTDQLTADDIVRGLNLTIGKSTTRKDLVAACEHFKKLQLYWSINCHPTIHGHEISLDISVEGEGMRVVFDNFVWTTRTELLARLKQEIPLFKPWLPEPCGLTSDILRVLQRVVDERGIKGSVRYDDRFWTIRGMNVFLVEGISVPVTALQIDGDNAPSPEDIAKWSQFYTKEDFSAARLTWIINFAKRDLYSPRGYLKPIVGEPVIQFLGEKDGTYPVRVILPISSGDLYTFDSVNFEGAAKEHAASLMSRWKLRPGEPYNKEYVHDFIDNEMLNAPWARRSNSESDEALPCARIDASTRKVSLTITIRPPKKTYKVANAEVDECGGVIKTLVFPAH